MPPREFLFALELSDEPHYETMLAELTGAVLAHVGYQAAAIEELGGVLRAALKQRAAGAPCDIRFRVEAGKLHITLTSAGRAEWQTTRPLP